MSIELAYNTLEIRSIASTAEPIAIPATERTLRDELLRRGIEQATVILWQVDCIRCGNWVDGDFVFPGEIPLQTEYLLELRIFNADSELHLRRENGQLIGRLRTDGIGERAEYVDSIARLWGECTDEGAWMTLCDRARKLSLTLPALPASSRHVGLVTRSYVGIHTETAQAGYTDMRFIDLVSADIKEEN